MGVAALVLGIVSLILGFIPIVGILGIGLAIIGLVLGIIDWVQKKKKDEKHGMAVAGTICSVVAIIIVILWTMVFSVLVYHVVDNVDENTVKGFVESIQELNETEKSNINFDFNKLFSE